MNNDEKIREQIEAAEVPEELSPENIKAMLDEKSAVKKRSRITTAGQITAFAAALTIVVTGGYFGGKEMFSTPKNKDLTCGESLTGVYPGLIQNGSGNGSAADSKDDPYVYKNLPDKPYMSSAANYGQVYWLFSESYKDYIVKNTMVFDSEYGAVSDGLVGSEYPESFPADEETNGTGSDSSGEKIHSETYDQEEGVREADIVKTDGENIYMVCGNYDQSYYFCDEESLDSGWAYLRVASVDDGRFTGTCELDVTQLSPVEGDGWQHRAAVRDMYIYNDMIAVISTDYAYRNSPVMDEFNEPDRWMFEDSSYTFVTFYTTGSQPKYIGSYAQEGDYTDVRIAPDGYMYLITGSCSYCFDDIFGEAEHGKYIPECGVNGNIELIAPENILLPNNVLDSSATMSYTIIGSIDMTVSGQFAQADTKALADYSGGIYCSAENLYTVCGWEDSEITRIAIGGGEIVPAASGKVDGYVLDQFSMSEYSGYFRVASSVTHWNYTNGDIPAEPERYNLITVLDMDMNIVGKSEKFGMDEDIKSANFSGDMGYVVTFRNTDPLFAFDLSDPKNPVITDEYKLPGYSSYMQKWSDGLLLGFGADGDEDGSLDGVKLVMFDNSDPYDLKEAGSYSVRSSSDEEWVQSAAMWERKALLIAPEKGIIGFPVYVNSWGEDNFSESKYVFVSYADGSFTYIGEVSHRMDNYHGADDETFKRAVYIGNYAYVLSEKRFVSADLETLAVKDSVSFAME